MGEVYVPAVDPRYQRHGVGRALLEHSFARSRHAEMAMVMVETGDDAVTPRRGWPTKPWASNAGPWRAISRTSAAGGAPHQDSGDLRGGARRVASPQPSGR